MSDQLRKADHGQSERLHRFAHDLRNRLAAIQQVLQHLGSPVEGMDHGELSVFGEQQYFKAMRQVEELLDDLGVDRMPRLTNAGSVSLRAVVEQAAADLAQRFDRKEQAVQLELTDDAMVLGDAHHLRDLVAALLSNASKFSRRGSTIRLALMREGGMAVLQVCDRGIGLDAEDLAQVFVRYVWLKGQSTDGEAQGRSTLARSRQWAEAHGGELQAHSEGPGEGSTFTLRLPLA